MKVTAGSENTFVEVLEKGSDVQQIIASWIVKLSLRELKKLRYAFDKMGSSGYPAVVAFTKMGSLKDAELLTLRLQKVTGLNFKGGSTNALLLYVQISERTYVGKVGIYIVVNVWKSGKVALKFMT